MSIALIRFFSQSLKSAMALLFVIGTGIALPEEVSSQQDGNVEVNLSPDRSIPPIPTYGAFRKSSEVRVWTFSLSAARKDIGRLVSSAVESNSVGSLELESKLDLDYTPANIERKLSVSSRTRFGSTGSYQADKISINVDGNEGKLNWQRKGSTLSFESRSGDQKVADEVALDSSVKVWEPYFVDQLELLLATRSIRVGDSLIDSVFQPQGRGIAQVRGDVPYFMWQELWKGRIDSVFIIRLSEPLRAQLYFTADRRLVRADFLDEDMRIYQDVITRTTAPKSQSFAEAMSKSLLNIRLASAGQALLLFLPLCILGFFFAKAGTESAKLLVPSALIGIVCGLVAGILQPALISLIIPALQRSGLIVLSTISALLVAVLSVALIVAGQFLLGRLHTDNQGNQRRWGIGLFGGLMFGVTNALVTLGQGRFALFSSATVEQVLLTVLFAMLGGVIVASGGKSRSTLLWIIAGLLTLTIWRMIPALTMATGLNTGALAAFYVVLTALWGGTIFLTRQFQYVPAKGGKKKR